MVNVYSSHNSQKQAAKFASLAYLFTFIIVVFANFGIYNKLIVPGDAVETARTIVANEWLFRAGVLSDLVYSIGFIIFTASLYTIFEETNRRVALVALLFQLAYVITWVALTLKFFDALRLVKGTMYLQIFSDEQAAALARLFLNARFDRYYGTLMFYTIGSTVFGLLWYKSGYIPKFLSVYGIVACAWCTLCAVVYLAYPEFESIVNLWLFDLPMAFFSITLSFWLLTKGLKL